MRKHEVTQWQSRRIGSPASRRVVRTAGQTRFRPRSRIGLPVVRRLPQVLDLDDVQQIPNLNDCVRMVRDDAYPVLRFVNRDLASPDSGSNEFAPITRYPFPVPPLCGLEPYVHFASILEAIMKFS